jgi:hypothetical protein
MVMSKIRERLSWMSLREYLIHLKWWLGRFPVWGEDDHTFVGIVDDPMRTCLVCHKIIRRDDEWDDVDWEGYREKTGRWSQATTSERLWMYSNVRGNDLYCVCPPRDHSDLDDDGDE